MKRAEAQEEKPVTDFQANTEIFEAQQFWCNRINGFYMNLLGMLAGMSVLHLIVILGVQPDKLLPIYSPYARNINLVFLVFANIALVLCFAMTLIYGQRMDEMQRSMDDHWVKFRRFYRVSAVTTFLQFVSWALLFYLPNFTSQLHYRAPSQISASDVNSFKGLFVIVNVLYLITWCLSSSIANAPDEISLEPEFDEYDNIELQDLEQVQAK